MDPMKKEKVFAQYINQYEDVVNNTLTCLRNNVNYLHIPYSQFLFSLIDYYGLIFRVADKNLNEKRKPENFKEFIASVYFPQEMRNKGNFLYFFRNGIIHQIFPKAGGINFQENISQLFYKENGNPILNLHYLDKVISFAMTSLIQELSNNLSYIDNLYFHLIEDKYALGDFNERDDVIRTHHDNDIENIYR